MSDKKIYSFGVSTSKRDQIIDITREVSGVIGESGISSGICYVHVPHTTAAVTINENADPDVRSDILNGLDAIVPDGLVNYRHAEGNSPAHIKTSMMGPGINVFVENGSLVLGTWQGIYFCEFDGPRARKVLVKVIEG